MRVAILWLNMMKIAVIIPTYNEKKNIEKLIRTVLGLEISGLEVVVVDDNSPDGTAEEVSKLSQLDSRVRLVSRRKKMGLGTAYLCGFKYALEHGAEYIFEVDADFSHDPKYIPIFLSQIGGVDLIVGSRYVAEGKIINWNMTRRLVSDFGNRYARLILGLPVFDLTTGYKCYRRRVVEYLLEKEIDAVGYVFQIETSYYALQGGFKIKEMPIVFTERQLGKSKFSARIIWESFWKVLRLRFRKNREKADVGDCPICGSQKLKKSQIKTQEVGGGRKMQLFSCTNCRVIFAADYQVGRNELYGENYAAWSEEDEKKERLIAEAKKSAFLSQLDELPLESLRRGDRVLDIGTGAGYLLEVLDGFGLDVWGTEISPYWQAVSEKKFPEKIFLGDLNSAKFKADSFDLVFMTDVLEHLPNPQTVICEIERILKPGGRLFMISPNSESLTRKILRQSWFQYKYEHIFYFNRKSLDHLLEKNKLQLVSFKNNWKKFSLNYYHYYFQKYSFWGLGKIFESFFAILPKRARSVYINNPVTGEFLAIAQKKK